LPDKKYKLSILHRDLNNGILFFFGQVVERALNHIACFELGYRVS
jgi:hypothetical protein